MNWVAHYERARAAASRSVLVMALRLASRMPAWVWLACAVIGEAAQLRDELAHLSREDRREMAAIAIRFHEGREGRW